MVQELALRQIKMLQSLIYIGDIAQLAQLCVTQLTVKFLSDKLILIKDSLHTTLLMSSEKNKLEIKMEMLYIILWNSFNVKLRFAICAH